MRPKAKQFAPWMGPAGLPARWTPNELRNVLSLTLSPLQVGTNLRVSDYGQDTMKCLGHL
jgi:hypothetical protein